MCVFVLLSLQSAAAPDLQTSGYKECESSHVTFRPLLTTLFSLDKGHYGC